MDKFELAQREIEKKSRELDDLEDYHQAKLKEFDAKSDYFQTAWQSIQGLLDEKYEETLYYLRATDADQSFYEVLNREIGAYQMMSEEALVQARRDLEIEVSEEEKVFRKKRKQLDQDLDEAFRRRRLAADQENQER
ncbi:hypothetical protein ACVRXQ_01920 [Streptococcus panodentis]|uniref:Flagellar FliJ protein n=1 Tax=Streptococcus panodentis TaxID=1581472 RepID=A0ABS5AX48_9STRE|nr:hypothetical protein [Streptococcus panodentis]MBP2621110.1 hypothetical protein [Streptococcus panodentis]